MKTSITQVVQEVQDVYHWIDERLVLMAQSCKGCGCCCDFGSFGHRLYVNSPELIFFQQHMDSQIMTMEQRICPYRINGKCSVYPYRFSGCRIFSCRGDTEKENALYEQALSKFKAFCDEYQLSYFYVDLKVGLQMLKTDQGFGITQ